MNKLNYEDPKFKQLLAYMFDSHEENMPRRKFVFADPEHITKPHSAPWLKWFTPNHNPCGDWNQTGYGFRAPNGDIFRHDYMFYGYTAQVCSLKYWTEDGNADIVATPCLLDILGNNVIVGISISFQLRELAPICDTRAELDKFLNLIRRDYVLVTELTSAYRCIELAQWLYEHNPNKKD